MKQKTSKDGEKLQEKEPWCAMSGCCIQPIVEAPVFYIGSDGQAEKIGKAWVCAGKNCGKAAKHLGGYVLKFKNFPGDFTQEVWNKLKEAGTCYRCEGRWGFYVGREEGLLKPMTAKGFAKVKELTEKEKAAANAYIPEPGEEWEEFDDEFDSTGIAQEIAAD